MVLAAIMAYGFPIDWKPDFPIEPMLLAVFGFLLILTGDTIRQRGKRNRPLENGHSEAKGLPNIGQQPTREWPASARVWHRGLYPLSVESPTSSPTWVLMNSKHVAAEESVVVRH